MPVKKPPVNPLSMPEVVGITDVKSMIYEVVVLRYVSGILRNDHGGDEFNSENIDVLEDIVGEKLGIIFESTKKAPKAKATKRIASKTPVVAKTPAAAQVAGSGK